MHLKALTGILSRSGGQTQAAVSLRKISSSTATNKGWEETGYLRHPLGFKQKRRKKVSYVTLNVVVTGWQKN